MRYGYFDSKNNEYVITRPDTPTAWINYIGAGAYGGIVSNTGGGYSFDRDPKNKRILRYRYNSIPYDQPGRYVYIRDSKTEKYWSATWQPCKPTTYDLQLTTFNYECRHGLGYTTIKLEQEKIQSEITYFVPENDQAMEVWVIKVKNLDTEKRDLKLFSYAEFSFYDAMKDQTNVDWCQQINQATFENETIFWTSFMKTMGYTYFTTSGKIDSFDADREKYVGPYRGLENPICVEKGHCSNSLPLRGNGVGGVCTKVHLNPGEEKEIVFILGTAEKKELALLLINKYRELENVHNALYTLKEYMNNYLAKLSVKTPDSDMDLMVNCWNQYQCKATFNWSRFVSLYQLGVNRGMGFRDTAQDTLGVMHTIPEEAKNTIIKLLKIQYKKGYAGHQFYPLTGEIDIGDAAEGSKKATKWYSDDHLWIVLAVASYIKETGDFDFLSQKVKFADAKEEKVLKHLEKAVEFASIMVGPHGLCLAGWADWDDTLNLSTGKGKAESVWTTQLLGVALLEMIELSKVLKNSAAEKKYQKLHQHFAKIMNSSAGWDGNWYLRAYTDESKKVGTHLNEKAKIYLLVQSWAIMANFADSKKAKTAMNSAHKYLNTKYGLVLIWPAYNGFDWRIGGTTTYPPGAKENGGIFLQTNPWQVIAAAMMGDGERAFEYYKQILPSSKNDIADIYEVEPYVYCQNILGKEHPQFGLGRNSWLTGTAAWTMVAASQYILGIRPDYNGLIIDPCIPRSWPGFDVTRIFRGTTYHITVKNPKKVSKGVKTLIVDRKEIKGNIIPLFNDENEHFVEVILG